MTSKFSRFLHLERSRGERPKPEEPSQLQSGNRFEALAQRGQAPQEAAIPEAHLERFKGEAPLAFADAPGGEQRFPRCGSCESENGLFDKECLVCGADLTTPQQRAYNEQLWQKRQALEREAAAQQPVLLQETEAQRQQEADRYAQLLEQLREKERQGDWGLAAAYQHPSRSIGLGLLSLIPHPLVRWGVGLGLIALPFLVANLGTRMARKTGMALGLFLVLIFLPRFFKPWRGR